MDKVSNMNKDHVVLQMKDIVKKFGDFTANVRIGKITRPWNLS